MGAPRRAASTVQTKNDWDFPYVNGNNNTGVLGCQLFCLPDPTQVFPVLDSMKVGMVRFTPPRNTT